ncbi:MAG: carotenoid oxygenase family protein [Myxococcota bacterium]
MTQADTTGVAGFASQLREVEVPDLPVQGELPRWLRGRLIRTGPARFEVGRDAYRHWFDGLAMLHQFELTDDGRASFRNRFVRSRSYELAMQHGRIAVPEFGTVPRRGPFGRLIAALRRPQATDNTNVNVARFGDVFLAMTETPTPLRFDPATLETVGPFEWRDDLEGALTTAHPQIDARRGKVFNHLTEFGPRCRYHVYALGLGDDRRVPIATLPVDLPAYIHSIGATENHLLFVECPLFAPPLRLRFGASPFRDLLQWKPERGTRIRAIHKDTGEVVADHRTDPMFAFHHVNAHESDGSIVMDLCVHRDDAVFEDLTLAHLRSSSPPSAVARLRRYVLWPGSGGRFEYRDLSDQELELPRVDPRVETLAHRHVYGATNRARGGFLDTLVKVDVETGDAVQWSEAGVFPGEAVFVPAPGGEVDEGVCLSVVLEAERDRSALLVLDATSFEERARIRVPIRVPYHFHGQFFTRA